ncbi:hypothetical protein MRX56_17215 [Pseudodesulfovibrio sp. S3-i]|nr:hypothetical protein [Pseudodesulfovibrio sp. S3-i]
MLLTECFHRLGYRLTILPRPNRRSICEADLGTVDGNYARTEAVAASYRNLIMIPEPLGWESITAFSADPNLKVDGWRSLLHHHVAWVNGRAICETHLGTAPQKTLVKNEKALLKFLSEGRAEVGVMGLKKGCDLLQRLNITNVRPLFPPLEVAQLYLYMHKKHEAIIPKVTEMLRTLKSDGTYEAIHQHLFTDAPYPGKMLSNPQP